MNVFTKTITYSICFLLLATVNCFAYPIIGNATRVIMDGSANRPAGSGGGEFTLRTDLGDSFAAFCVEYDEHMGFGIEYEISSVADYASQGGGPDHGASWDNGEYRDYLSNETKWLMNEYVNGGLKQKYASKSGATLGGAMQVAIWFLEDENYGNPNYSIGYTAGSLIMEARNSIQSMNQLDMSLFSNVKVVNLMDADGEIQSQLIAAPVPEPATMLLLGTGMIGLAGAGRKKRKK